jgi:membrane associated rhomboid family serine protease
MAFQSNPFQRSMMPPVVKNLLIINGLAFLATLLLEKQGIDLTDRFGLHYFQAPKFQSFQLVTYMFLHGGWMHIIFNMFALWMFGSVMENEWGPKKFLTYYFVCGIGAALVQNLVIYYEMKPAMTLINDYLANPSFNSLQNLTDANALRSFSSPQLVEHFNTFLEKFNSLYHDNPQSAIKSSVDFMSELRNDIFNAPLVIGASGAIFGLLLAYGMTFPNNLIFIYGIIPLKAKWLVILYGAVELYSGLTPSPTDNVAHFAHLGGLLFGFLLLMYWRGQNRDRFRNY